MIRKRLVATAFLGSAMAIYSVAQAGTGHDHDHEHDVHHATHAPKSESQHHKDFGTVANAWQTLTASVKNAERAVIENAQEDIDAIYDELAASAHYLLDNSTLEDKKQEKRLLAALGQLTGVIEIFHSRSHSGFGPETRRELKKIQGALRLVETYYPKSILIEAGENLSKE